MLYWDGPLFTREQAIEIRRRRLRQSLLALDCMTELIPLMNKLPEIGDYSEVLCDDFDELRRRVAKFVTDKWSLQDCSQVLGCLDRWGKKKTIPVHVKLVLCESLPTNAGVNV